MPPIYLIAGAPAVGKSSVARALAMHYPRSIHIPVDNLRDMVVGGLVYPGDRWSQALIEQLALARECAVHMALQYHAAGFMVALDDFWDPNSRLLEYQPLFAQAQRILLYPGQQTAQARNRARAGAGDASVYIAAGIRAVYDHLQDSVASLARDGWLVVDTTDHDVDATVQQIRAQAG